MPFILMDLWFKITRSAKIKPRRQQALPAAAMKVDEVGFWQLPASKTGLMNTN